MKIILKYLLKSLLHRRVQTGLVIFSITCASSLIFANEGFKNTCEKMFYEADTRHAGTADYLAINELVEIDDQIMDKLHQEDGFQYVAPIIKQDLLYAPSVEEMYYYHTYGMDYKDYMDYNPVPMKSGTVDEFSGNQVIVGDAFAKINGWNVGDSISLEYNQVEYAFEIVGISQPKGIFLRELADGGTMIIPLDTMKEITDKKVNMIYFKLKDSATMDSEQEANQLKAQFEKLGQKYPQLNLEYTIDTQLIRAETNTYVMPFKISSIAVFFMSMFLIHAAFKILYEERISSFGIMRSVGLTKKKLNKLLVFESGALGIIGGVAGCILGIGVFMVIQKLYFSQEESFGSTIALTITLKQVLMSVLGAVILAVISMLLPILGIWKKSVKDIMLQKPDQKVTKKSKGWVIGITICVLVLVGANFIRLSWVGMVVASTFVTFLLVSIILLSNGLLRLVSHIFTKIRVDRAISLGVQNVRDNKILANNFRLFAVMIALVSFMVSLFKSMSYDLHDAYATKYLYDATVEVVEPISNAKERFEKIEGVACVEPYNMNYDMREVNTNTFMNGVYGIDGKEFFDYYWVPEQEEIEEMVAKLDDESIITTKIVQSKFGFSIGDTMELQFKIVGFVDTNLGIGHTAYISSDAYNKMTGTNGYHLFCVKGKGSQEQLKRNIKRAFTKNISSLVTKEEQELANADKVDSIFNAINSYTYFAVIIGLIGLFNQIISGYLERKRSIALYRCMGMSKKSISKMIFVEALVIGILGSGLGVIVGVIMMQMIPYLVGMMWGFVVIKPAYLEMLCMVVFGLVGLLMVSMVPLRASRKISLLEHLRYE
jgi:putative ABC transport system permease protein